MAMTLDLGPALWTRHGRQWHMYWTGYSSRSIAWLSSLWLLYSHASNCRCIVLLYLVCSIYFAIINNIARRTMHAIVLWPNLNLISPRTNVRFLRKAYLVNCTVSKYSNESDVNTSDIDFVFNDERIWFQSYSINLCKLVSGAIH